MQAVRYEQEKILQQKNDGGLEKSALRLFHQTFIEFKQFWFSYSAKARETKTLSTADTEVPISSASVCARRKFRSSKLTDRRLNRFVSGISIYPFIVVVYFNTIYGIQMRKAVLLSLLPEDMIRPRATIYLAPVDRHAAISKNAF